MSDNLKSIKKIEIFINYNLFYHQSISITKMNTASIMTMNTIKNYLANINKIDTDIAKLNNILDNDNKNMSLKDETALKNDKYDLCYDKYRLITEVLYYGLTYRNVWTNNTVIRTLYNLSIRLKDQLENTTIPIRTIDDARTRDEFMKVLKQTQTELSEDTKMTHNYHFRPGPKLTKYHGMDTIEPIDEYDDITDIYYDESQHYDEDYVYETDYDDDELDDEDEDNESIIETDTDEDDDDDDDNDSDYDELEFEEDCKWVKVLDDFYDNSYWNYVEEEKYDIAAIKSTYFFGNEYLYYLK